MCMGSPWALLVHAAQSTSCLDRDSSTVGQSSSATGQSIACAGRSEHVRLNVRALTALACAVCLCVCVGALTSFFNPGAVNLGGCSGRFVIHAVSVCDLPIRGHALKGTLQACITMC